VVRLAVGLLCLLTVATLGALAVDAVEVTAPVIRSTANCDGNAPNPYLDASTVTPTACRWAAALARDFPRTSHIQIDETKTGDLQATATITTTTADPLVSMVRHGDGQDGDNFFRMVLGYVTSDDYEFFWSPPTVAVDATDTAAVITVTGQPSEPKIPSTVHLLVGAGSASGSVEVTTQGLIIGGLSGDGTVSSENAHALTVENPKNQLRITLQPGTPQQNTESTGPAGARRLARGASLGWGLVSGYLGMVLPASTWIGLFLASRMGAFGGVGRRPAWRRMERVLGAAVIADLAASACFQLTVTESSLENTTLARSWIANLQSRMFDARLWDVNGYPAILGGTILLVAFSFVAVAWDPRPPRTGSGRTRYGATAAACLGFAALVLYVVMAVAGPNLDLGDDSLQEADRRFPMGAAFAVTAVVVLLVLFMAGARMAGEESAALTAAGRPPDRPSPFTRTRMVVSGLTFLVAATIATVAMTALFAFHRNALRIDTLTLWAGGSIAWLVTFAVLAAAVVTRLPARSPQATTSRRHAIGILVVLALAAVVLLLPIPLIASAASRSADGGSDAHISGPAAFVICLTAAATLVAFATTVRRPQGTAREIMRYSWAVPAIVLLGILASVTTANGYVPVLLRWGVVVVAGACLGVALSRLVAAAVGPLRPPASRTPRLRSVVLVAAVAAVPWGALGHGDPVVWWDLGSYANRLDGVLPLVLVAGTVVALRRIGLPPVRDEAALAGHRRLGIALWAIVFSAGYSFGGVIDWEGTAALTAAAGAAWVLMPRRQIDRASLVLRQAEQETADAVRRSLDVGIARRMLPGLAKTMRDKVAAGEADFTDAQKKLADLEKHTSATATGAVGWKPEPVADGERAFGASISHRPWVRARWGMTYAAVAGAPWVVLGLAGASVSLSAPEGYPELAFVSAVAPLVLRWVGYGLLFGYFFPLLRGKTGLGKSMSFFVAALAPSVLGALASPHSSGRSWHSAALLGVQLLIFALTMGLLADLAVLRRHGFTADRLVDLHSLWTVSAWASSVVVAVGTGVATVIVAGLQPFVIGVITPSQSTTPPAAVSHQQ
jgi:hypothetical protein